MSANQASFRVATMGHFAFASRGQRVPRLRLTCVRPAAAFSRFGTCA
jgi:hypothetical protein